MPSLFLLLPVMKCTVMLWELLRQVGLKALIWPGLRLPCFLFVSHSLELFCLFFGCHSIDSPVCCSLSVSACPSLRPHWWCALRICGQTQCSACVLDLEVWIPLQVPLLSAVWPWATHLTCLSLGSCLKNMRVAGQPHRLCELKCGKCWGSVWPLVSIQEVAVWQAWPPDNQTGESRI